MNSADLKTIIGIYRNGIEERLEELNRQLIAKNPDYDPKIFKELLDLEKWAVRDAWQEIYGREEKEVLK